MKYVGFNQHICEKGHLFTTYDESVANCPMCHSSSAWHNHVNNVHCNERGIILHWEQVKLSDRQEKVIDGIWYVAPARYRIPTPDEARKMRMYFDDDEKEYFHLLV